MFFRKYLKIETILYCSIIITPLHTMAKPMQTEIKEKHDMKLKQPVKKNVDSYITNILLQDTTNIIDPSLPSPFNSLKYSNTQFLEEEEQSKKNSLFDEEMKDINPIVKTLDYSKLKETEDESNRQIVAKKIHELEKEAYMLRSQLILLENKKISWLINPKRSGYYIGVGFMFGFRQPENFLGVETINFNAGSIVKFGYLRYFYNNSGLKVELFGIYGGVPHIDENVFYSYYGLRFSVIHDIPVFIKNNYFGFFAGFGAGGYVFRKQDTKDYAFLEQAHNIHINFHIGASWSYAKHHRIDVERIFVAPVVTRINNVIYNFEPSYIVSYSWVF